MINEDSGYVNYWPSVADIAFAMLSIMIVIIFVQFLAGSKALETKIIEENQKTMNKLVVDKFGEDYKKDITVEVDGNIQRVRFSDQILFDSGKYELKKTGAGILTELVDILYQNRNLYDRIQVEGHTDNIPIHTGNIPDNWVLSSLRATEVVRFFRWNLQIEGKLLSATGYGEFQPIAGNDIEEGRAKNRRIEIVIIYSTKDIIKKTKAKL